MVKDQCVGIQKVKEEATGNPGQRDSSAINIHQGGKMKSNKEFDEELKQFFTEEEWKEITSKEVPKDE